MGLYIYIWGWCEFHVCMCMLGFCVCVVCENAMCMVYRGTLAFPATPFPPPSTPPKLPPLFSHLCNGMAPTGSCTIIPQGPLRVPPCVLYMTQQHVGRNTPSSSSSMHQ